MAIQLPPPIHTQLLTYEEYMAEEEIALRYDIVDGVREFMSAPTWQHQRIQFNASMILRRYEEASGRGYVLGAPFDLLLSRVPLRTRQPDVLFITHARIASGGGIPAKGPMDFGPELVVEILSDSDRQRVLADKLADYIRLGVVEAWVVRPDDRTVELLRLTANGPVSAGVCDDTQTFTSLTFPDLTVTVAEIFRP